MDLTIPIIRSAHMVDIQRYVGGVPTPPDVTVLVVEIVLAVKILLCQGNALLLVGNQCILACIFKPSLCIV